MSLVMSSDRDNTVFIHTSLAFVDYAGDDALWQHPGGFYCVISLLLLLLYIHQIIPTTQEANAQQQQTSNV